ncbi:MAG: transporter substrate-binding domain-containing protein [Melioribacteraceae bacterium]|nr:transporter substrate-binding domain-containing protein [Melioribacteraceae bacterium]
MNKLYIILFILLFSFALFAQNRVIRVGAYDNPPKIFKDDDGIIKGIYPDVLEAIALANNWTIKYEYSSWDYCLKKLQENQLDLMPDVAWMSERKSFCKYSHSPLLSDWLEIYSRRGINIESFLDLDGLTVSVLNNSIQEHKLREMVNGFDVSCEVMTVDNIEDIFISLTDDRADAGIINRFFGEYSDTRFNIVKTGIVFFPSKTYFVVPLEGDTTLLNIIDIYIDTIKKDRLSVYYQSIKKWMGEEHFFKLPTWILQLIIFMTSAILTLSVFYIIAKHHLAQKKRELEIAHKEALRQERLHALGQLASGIAHDFNNILSPVLGYSEMMIMNPDLMKDREKCLKRLRSINNAARDGIEIVKRLREFYKPKDEDEIDEQVFLDNLVEEVIDLVHPRIDQYYNQTDKILNVKTDLQKVPPVLGKPSELREALMNLIFNAMDAMPNGGQLQLNCRQNNDRVEMTISDTGSGMSDEVRKKCMEPFFSTKGERGTGLGLSMVKSIIDDNNGTIDLHSILSKGTTWTISFPIVQQQTPLKEEENQFLFVQALKIALVDDDYRTLDSMKEMLENQGHTVSPFLNSSDALEACVSNNYNVLITDQKMPGIEGTKLAEILSKITSSMSIILMTGSIDIKQGFSEEFPFIKYILKKPVSISSLNKALIISGFAQTEI